MDKKIILITGASSGIGYQTAEILAKQGHTVYGAARRIEKLNKLKPYGVIPIELDVTLEISMKDAIEKILKSSGRIDVLINNAGYGSFGTVENVSIEEARRQFEVNLFGMARLIQLVLPTMRKHRTGRIINISSMGGRLVSFMGAWYHATKYAVEALSDALRMETAEFGIQVSLIEPGLIKTDWGHIAADYLAESSVGSAYEKQAKKTSEGIKRQYSGKMPSDPIIVSKAIVKAVNSRHPKSRYLIGFGAKPLVFAHAVLPTKLFDFMMKRAS